MLCGLVFCAGWVVGITGPTIVDPEVVKKFALFFGTLQFRPPARTFESLVGFWRDVLRNGEESVCQGGEVLVCETCSCRLSTRLPVLPFGFVSTPSFFALHELDRSHSPTMVNILLVILQCPGSSPGSLQAKS